MKKSSYQTLSFAIIFSALLFCSGWSMVVKEVPGTAAFADGLNARNAGRYAEAAEAFRKAYNETDDNALKAKAIIQLAKLYSSGRGVPKNPAYAIKLLQSVPAYDSAENSIKAQDMIIQERNKMQLAQQRRIEHERLKAQRDAEKAAKRAESKKEHQNDKGQDKETAEMIRKAEAYSVGKEGFKQDLTEAYNWYAKAAELGNGEAQYQLGVAYAQGVGVNKDRKKAEYWLGLAKDNGYPLAMQVLEVLE